MDEAKRIKRQALFVCVALLPVSALIVATTTDRSLTWYWWILATVLVALFLCLFRGLVSMILGFLVCLVNRDSETGKFLIGFGACLGAIFFLLTMVFSIFRSDDQGS